MKIHIGQSFKQQREREREREREITDQTNTSVFEDNLSVFLKTN